MEKMFVMYAKYNQAGNRAVYDILDKLGNDEREKERGSFYGSLSGLFRHIIGGTWFFLGMYRDVLKDNVPAAKAVDSIKNCTEPPSGDLTESQWKELGGALEKIDAACLAMTEALSAADMDLPVKIEWYGGNPPSVPLSFMLNQLMVHNTHHRGQISQILDFLKIDNDYSGIDAAFLPR